MNRFKSFLLFTDFSLYKNYDKLLSNDKKTYHMLYYRQRVEGRENKLIELTNFQRILKQIKHKNMLNVSPKKLLYLKFQ